MNLDDECLKMDEDGQEEAVIDCEGYDRSTMRKSGEKNPKNGDLEDREISTTAGQMPGTIECCEMTGQRFISNSNKEQQRQQQWNATMVGADHSPTDPNRDDSSSAAALRITQTNHPQGKSYNPLSSHQHRESIFTIHQDPRRILRHRQTIDVWERIKTKV